MKNVQKYQLCCSPLMSTLFIVSACHWCLQKNFLSGVGFYNSTKNCYYSERYVKKFFDNGPRLVMEHCQLGVTCDNSGHKVPNNDKALKRQTGEQFRSDASADCRVRLAPNGCK